MTNPMVRIHDIATNTIIDREMTDEEFVQKEADQAAEVTRQTEEAAKVAAKAQLLVQLGITEEQAKLLLS